MARKIDQFNLDEVFRHLRTNIEFSQVDETVKVINVLSTFPNEGKSTVSTNLARIFADKYQNVLLIDCDLRNPTDHKMYKVSNAEGLTNLLTEYVGDNLYLVIRKSFRFNSRTEAGSFSCRQEAASQIRPRSFLRRSLDSFFSRREKNLIM
ncbi:hypothetical protein [Dubosiella newyorkensis]|uniref:nucleotide-binding protein n=1 Tax=Dubosiella newyorkensis TaxID=1862672 RepID=UPI0023EFE583|nr:hypothetical protein [Dubosiella newyorkensis]